jgi:hypothetical protein
MMASKIYDGDDVHNYMQHLIICPFFAPKVIFTTALCWLLIIALAEAGPSIHRGNVGDRTGPSKFWGLKIKFPLLISKMVCSPLVDHFPHFTYSDSSLKCHGLTLDLFHSLFVLCYE